MGSFMGGLMGAIEPELQKRRADEERQKEIQAKIYMDHLKSGAATADSSQYALDQIGKIYGHKGVKELLGKVGNVVQKVGAKGENMPQLQAGAPGPQDAQRAAAVLPPPPGVRSPATTAITAPPQGALAETPAAQALPPPKLPEITPDPNAGEPSPLLKAAGGSSAAPAVESSAQSTDTPGDAGGIAGLPSVSDPNPSQVIQPGEAGYEAPKPATQAPVAVPQAPPTTPASIASAPLSLAEIAKRTYTDAPKARKQFETDERIREDQAKGDLIQKRAEANFNARRDRARAIIAADPEMEKPETRLALEVEGIHLDPISRKASSVTNIPGGVIQGGTDPTTGETIKSDAFGKPIDPKYNYSNISGKYYPTSFVKDPEDKPEKAPPGELGVRQAAQTIIDDPKAPPQMKDQARKTLKHLDDNDRGVQVRIQNGQTNSGGGLTENQLQKLGEYESVTGKSVPMRTAAQVKMAAALADRLNAKGVYENQDYRAESTSLNDLTKRRGTVGAQEGAFQREIGLARQAADKVPRSSVQKFNSWSQLAAANLTDDPQLATFRTYIQTVKNRYAQIMTGGNARPLESNQKHADELINSAMAKHTLNAALDAMQNETKTMTAGLDDQIGRTRGGGNSSPAGQILPPPGSGAKGDPLGIR